MKIDLHSHYFPPEAIERAGALPLALDALPDGKYRFTAGGKSLTLEQALFDPQIQLADMRRQGLDRRVLAVPPFVFQYELEAEAGIRWSRALNDGIAAVVRAHPESFIGFATLPLQDLPAALAELDRAVHELGLQGVEIAGNIHGVELDAPELDPFWARAESLWLPVLIHPHHVPGAQRMQEYHLRNLIGNPVETALAGARLIFGGVLERFPGLRVILSHGGGVLPSLLGRLAHGYAVRKECKVRAASPMESLRRLYYDTIVFDGQVLRHLVETFGAPQVVLGTDYPFDMALDRPVDFVLSAGLSAGDEELILNGGARLIPGELSHK